MAGGAVDFSAAIGVLPLEILAPSAMAGGAADFSADDRKRQKKRKKKLRWLNNKKKKRLQAATPSFSHQATSPSMANQETSQEDHCKGMSLCVFNQCGFCGWCARGNYDCTCCEGATSLFGYAL
jgi:hypothetical protein